MPVSPTRHLHHKAIKTSLGVIADLPDTQRQAQRGRQNGKMRKYAPNKITTEILRERMKRKEPRYQMQSLKQWFNNAQGP